MIPTSDIDKSYWGDGTHNGSVETRQSVAGDDDVSVSHDEETAAFDAELDVIIPTDDDEIQEEEEDQERDVKAADAGDDRDELHDDDDEPNVETEIM